MARNPIEDAQEVQQMLVAYAKQETVGPLRTLGRYLGFGIGGSIAMFVGVFFLSLASLRFFQTVDVFSTAEGETVGWMSTLPYVITLGVLITVIGLIYLTLSRATRGVTND